MWNINSKIFILLEHAWESCILPKKSAKLQRDRKIPRNFEVGYQTFEQEDNAELDEEQSYEAVVLL